MTGTSESSASGVVPRREAYGGSGEVGARGARTQQRILRAALEVFDEVGYHECSVDRIADKAGCSRPTFYQYFAGKEEVFRRLSGDLAGRLVEVASGPEPFTPDVEGRRAIRSFVSAYGDLYDMYAPVFAVYSTAIASDDVVATEAAGVFDRQVAPLMARVDRRAFGTRRAAEVTAILLNGVARAHRISRVLPDTGRRGLDRDRVEDALADVMHRAFFGPREGVNVHAHVPMAKADRTPTAPLVRREATPAPREDVKFESQRRLLDAGRAVFAARGYRRARVDDIVELAATSKGLLWWHFESKEAFFSVIAAEAGQRVMSQVDALPSAAGMATGELRAWLRRYLEIYAIEGPIMRAWIEAMWADPYLREPSLSELERLRHKLARFLAPRGFGDIDADALVLMALLDQTQNLPDSGNLDVDPSVDAYVLVLERALLRSA